MTRNTQPVPSSPSDRHRQKINYFLASLRTKPITQPQRSVHLNTARAIPLWLYGERPWRKTTQGLTDEGPATFWRAQ